MTDQPHKKAKIEDEQKSQLIVQFYDAEGIPVGPELDMPDSVNPDELEQALNSIQESQESYTFYLSNIEVRKTLKDACKEATHPYEIVVPLTFHPQSLFRVAPATRATSCLEGHTEAILCVQYSPDGMNLASAGGDTTVRLWDVLTETPYRTMEGHSNWVLLVSWSPDGKKLASAGVDGTIRLWNPETGEQIGKPLAGHRKWVNALSWEPFHVNPDSSRLASGSKDNTIRVWDITTHTVVYTISGHSASVSKVLWGGSGYIYSSSQDRTVKVWDGQTGRLVRELKGHAHWVNQLSVSTDFVLRTGFYDPFAQEQPQENQKQSIALERFKKVEGKGERLVSCSDDFTIILWTPTTSKDSVARMTGHQQLVSQVSYSPDGHFVVSASHDKSVKLWDGFNGQFLSNFRGHVGAVYQVCWSPDSRMFATGSKDSTVKIWSMKKKGLLVDLPGHADQVYTLDWSPDGLKLASGGRDRILNIWRS